MLCYSVCINAQLPSSFSWENRHGYEYISDAKPQIINGPCGVFAAIAAVEAMCHIYYNNTGINEEFDFSEAYVYNDNSVLGCTGAGCLSNDAPTALNFAKTTGYINDDSFPWPDTITTCLVNCSGYNGNPNQRVYIPNYTSEISISTNSDLKSAILNYGPIIMRPSSINGNALHPGYPGADQIKHTVLFIGWDGSQWWIKDSWMNTPSIDLKTYSVFNYQPTFYRVYPVNPQNSNDVLRCSGSQSELFTRKGWDVDGDGFYSWGLESYGRPNGCAGPNLMDWDDYDEDHIFRSGDTIYDTPELSGPSRVCQCDEGDRRFWLDYVPDGFSSSWYISKNAYCFNTYQGDGSSVYLYPNSSCIGKESEITFRITQNGDGGYAEYKKSFYVNCPREDLMSYTVLDSYGGSPAKYGDTYYLCPYTTYNIFFNENDPDCSVSNLDWDLPYGWSEHYRYSNYISIYTNDWPDGFLEIQGTTDCNSSEITLMSPFFAAAECGGYFLAYPNPSKSFVDIDVDKIKLRTDNISIDGKCKLTLLDKSGMIKFNTEFQGFPYRIDTSVLPEGMYFINIVHKGKTSTIRLIIKH